MYTTLLTEIDDVRSLSHAWRKLQPTTPMLTPQWLLSWWETYRGSGANCNRKQLFFLAVYTDQGQLVGIAPWYQEKSPFSGKTLSFLGTGTVCSDHLSIICEPRQEAAVVNALANWLTGRGALQWDAIRLEGIDAKDPAIGMLVDHFRENGLNADVRESIGCWQLELPSTWEEYLQSISKNHRKRCRRWEREFIQTGRSQVYTATNKEELALGFQILQRLHNQRRQSLGERGIFESDQFKEFHESALPRLLDHNQLRLSWLEIDRKPAACEYQLLGNDSIHAYQSGVAPEFLDVGAGNLSVLISIKTGIESGLRLFDFMRGDEAYKAKWGATRRSMNNVLIRQNNMTGTIRHAMARTNYHSKQWIKNLATSLAVGSEA